MNFKLFCATAALFFAPLTVPAVITIANVTDKTKYDAPRSFTITADPSAVTTTATLNGVATTVGSAVSVTAIGYQELKAESRDANGDIVDSRIVRFITRNPSRVGTEDGIPTHTPYRSIDDAPSAFAGQTLQIVAPAAWPASLPVPMAALLHDDMDETVRLNGVVTFGGFPTTTLQLRRGWGSVLAPAVTNLGTVNVAASVNGLTANPAIAIESNAGYFTAPGVIASDTTWDVNSRMQLPGTLTINAGATLTIEAGTIVKIYTGTATAGSAAEIVVNGTLRVNGSAENPVVFTSDTAGRYWGGIEMPGVSSRVDATYAIFTGAGEDPTWFNTHSGYSTHKPHQALFLISGSGAGTSVGAQLHLTNCYCFSLAGQQMNSRRNTWIDLQRTLMQRAVTGGELNGSKVTIEHSALIEFPSEDSTFADADNDALYLTNGDESIRNTVIGYVKDDGVDSGADGGDNPFTPANDVTPFVLHGNWFEGTFHEGNSLSGTRNVSYTNCVFFNCGQGIETGYSAGSTADGPNAVVENCLFVGNMVGVRWGDNYGSGYNYNGTMSARNSFMLNNIYRDAFSGQWHPTDPEAWIYQDATAFNSFGKPFFDLQNNYLSQADPLHHPSNFTWNASVNGALLAPFMPVPGSDVGVGISSYGPAQNDTAAYPGNFTVRLSTFSSHQVTVDWVVIAKTNAFGSQELTVASGTLTFASGETLKNINAPIANPGNFGLIRVALQNPVNAEVTREAWYFKAVSGAATLVARGSSGWRYRETRTEPPATWKSLPFDDSSPSATEWLPATLPAGYGVGGVTFGTTVTPGSSSDRTKAFYFRKKFTVSDLAQISALTFRVRRDDAAVVWLNNEATPSVVSADGALNPPYTYAMTGVPNSSNTDNYLAFAISPSKLVTGENILAIEVHQTSLTSGDLILDCELIATSAGLDLDIARVGGDGVVFWPDAQAILEETTDLNVPFAPRPGVSSPLWLDLNDAQRFFRLRK